MIDPLRYRPLKSQPFEVSEKQMCDRCLKSGITRKATLICPECPKFRYFCDECDAIFHAKDVWQLHVRKQLVVGSGWRKRILRFDFLVTFETYV